MVYVLHYDIAAFIIIITVMIHFYYKKTINTRQTKLFSYLISIAAFSILMDILSSIAIYFTEVVPVWLNYFLCISYFVSFKAIPAIYFVYLVSIIKGNYQISKSEYAFLIFPYLIEIMLILTTSWTKLIFYFDAAKLYNRGSLLLILYVVDIIYITASLWFTYKYRKRLTSLQSSSVYFYTISMLIAVCVQYYLPDHLLLEFATSLSILLIYLSLENPENYEDKHLGIFNNFAFTEVLNNYFENQRPFEIIAVQIKGLQYVNDTFGIEQCKDLMRQIAQYLTSRNEHLKVFYITQQRFTLVGDIPKEHWDIVLADIRNRFKYPFQYNDVNVMISGLFCMVRCPIDADCVKDCVDMIDYSLVSAEEIGSDLTIYASKEILYQGRRENRILQIIKKALLEDGFEVYYQPLYSASAKAFVAAEALVRIKDTSQGDISPEEFIPIAEKNGLILEIGALVFRKTCQFISENRIWEKGIHYVDVNLSVVQCMQESLYDQLLAIMDEYKLDYKYIAFEITESVAANSTQVLQSNLQRLKERDIRILLDDYGTGFTNLVTVVQFHFAAIKLDKSMLWSAMDNMKAAKVLKYTIGVIQEMGLNVIAEGVETQEQADMLVDFGCDLHQGYFYSKPVCPENFIQKIQATN